MAAPIFGEPMTLEELLGGPVPEDILARAVGSLPTDPRRLDQLRDDVRQWQQLRQEQQQLQQQLQQQQQQQRQQRRQQRQQQRQQRQQPWEGPLSTITNLPPRQRWVYWYPPVRRQPPPLSPAARRLGQQPSLLHLR
ncbi:hypothetical protein QBC43DRAFT_331764 [Cladorrhinum sp. PSN259]|nr:hypothetical protein QBC43DRAFT_331764 [Cladorrhinum sp. PSN259]